MMKFPKPSNIPYEADILEKVTKALLELNQAKVARVVIAGMLNDGMACKSYLLCQPSYVPVGENHVATAKVRMTDDRTFHKVMTIANHSIRISADRGGTFCDVYACVQPSMYTI
jgi:hypothetical protein